MLEYNVVLPSKPKVVSEDEKRGVYEIDGLYAGYGHTLGNSLRRIILSSLPGFAITSVKIGGVPHEFSTIEGVKEDVVTILLNLKKVRFVATTDEPHTISFSFKGIKSATAGDIKTPGQIKVLNPEQHIAELTDKGSVLDIELVIEKGLGYVPREVLQKGKVDIGTIAVDAIFTPIRRVNYEVENMRVGDRTDYNRLRIVIETDGTLTPREALESSIDIMIRQLKSIVGFKEEDEAIAEEIKAMPEKEGHATIDADVLKTRIETLDLSARTANALLGANVRTVGGLARKKEEDLLEVDGLGTKGIQEIKKMLGNMGITLK
ncbi:MAG: DNA-directed RNA polymerase subunit alpha [Patescibacteria group bacterium]